MHLKYILLLFILTVSGTAFSQTIENIISDGHTLHLKTFGEGMPVLIINGGPGMSSEGFIPLAKIIGKSHKAIIYDQRGTGKSILNTVNSTTVTMDLMLEDIETIRKHLKLNNWVIFGHSFGGMLASYYASKYPDRVKGLVLSSSGGVDLELLSNLNINSRLTKVQQKTFQYWSAKIANGDTTYYARLQRGKNLAPAYLYDKSHVNAIAKRLTQGNMKINSLVWQDMRTAPFDCKAALQRFAKPVLIIQGEHDIIDKQISEKAHALFKNSELVILDKAAHYGWLEQPDLYFGEIQSFLTALK